MAQEAASRVEVVAVGACAAASMVWRMRGELRVSVIVKGTFAMQPDAPMRVVAPDEIVTTEVHHANNPSRSVRLTTDLVPYLPAADVVLTGHACAPQDETALGMSVRLAVYRENALLDKSINVLCSTEDGCDVPFETMPLVYEKAYGGVGYPDNPFGAGVGSEHRTPNLADPSEEVRVACFAPVARGWPNRRKLLGKTDRRALEAAVCDVPDGFNFAYFQAAPQDQQIPYLQGNEWVVLEGMHPVHTQICSCLPSAIGRARVYGVGAAGQGRALALVADVLRIDADSLTCSVTWRGSFAVSDPAVLERLVIHAGIDTADRAVDWPPPPDAPAHRATPLAPPAAPAPTPQVAPTRSAPPAAGQPTTVSQPPQPPGASTQPSAVAPPQRATTPPAEETPDLESTMASPAVSSPVAGSPHPFTPAAQATPGTPGQGTSAQTTSAQQGTSAQTTSAQGATAQAAAARQGTSTQGATAQAAAARQGTSGGAEGSVDGSTTAPSATSAPPPAPRARKWDSTVELGDQEPPRPSAATPFRKGPVQLPPPADPPKRKPDFSATIATTELTDQPERPPATLPFQRQHVRPATPHGAPTPIAQAPIAQPPIAQPHAQAPIAQPHAQAPIAQPHAQAPIAQPHAQAPIAQPHAQAPIAQPPIAQAPIAQPIPPPPVTVPFPAAAARLPTSPAQATPLPARMPLPNIDLGAPAPAASGPSFPLPAAAPAETQGARAPRTAEGIEIVNETPLVLGTARWDTTPPRDVITVLAKVTCDLVPDGPAAIRAETPALTKDRVEPGPRGALCVYPSDLAPFKVRADVTLVGTAHAPPGGAAEMEVRFKFGEGSRGFDRRLLVLGDRTWVKSGAFWKPSAPERFLQLPLSRDRAFGGKGFDENTAGLGHFTGNPKSPVPMPNLEDPGQRLRTPKQSPEPACFAPILAGQAPRSGADPAARSLPERFDWSRHQAAPRAQRLPFLRGDEPFEIAGIHPKLPVLKGTLPGVVARVVAERASGAEEIPMRLDTVTFDLDERTVTLVWRGHLTVPDERAQPASSVRSLRLTTAPIDDDSPKTA